MKGKTKKPDFQDRLDYREEIFNCWTILTEEENTLNDEEIKPKVIKRIIRNNCKNKIVILGSHRPQQKRVVQHTSEKSLRDMNIPPIHEFLKYLESKAIDNPAEDIEIKNLLSKSEPTGNTSKATKKGKCQKKKTVVKKRKKAMKQAKKSKLPQEEIEASLESVICDPYHLTSIQNLPIAHGDDNEFRNIVKLNTNPVISADDNFKMVTVSSTKSLDYDASDIEDDNDLKYDADDFDSTTTTS